MIYARPGQLLSEHCMQVSRLCEHFCSSFNAGTWGKLIGLAHDWGKFSGRWQDYMLEQKGEETHAPQSAAELVRNFPESLKFVAPIAAFCVYGHHGSLPDGIAGLDKILQNPECYPISGELSSEFLPDWNAMVPGLKSELGLKASSENSACEDTAFLIRMLFSACVDADRLDAERFTSPENSELRSDYDSFEILEQKFEAYMAQLAEKSEKSRVNRIRAEILDECRRKAELPPQFFSLNVPTGGGKTLSSMAFALNHLKRNGMSRIVVAIPFTSIIDQSADKYREIFGDRNVLEHHSNFEPDKRAELAAENWDSPIIVTTTVQLFESLLKGRASSSRKIHNLANSVIILDEAQKLPPEHMNSILSTLRTLVSGYGCTVVLCSATIPALEGHVGEYEFTRINGLPGIMPIIDDPQGLSDRLRRTHITNIGLVEMDALAERLEREEQVLCIVNSRKKCRDLFNRIAGRTKYHLSALMCPADRRRVLEDIRRDLKENIPVVVIATSLVEAGVDLDFRVVYREISGLDSIAQAAGRCNREGRHESGEVSVFELPGTLPPGTMAFSANAYRSCLESGGVFPELTQTVYRKYFKNFYTYCGLLLNSDGFSNAFDVFPEFAFRKFGDTFNMIDNEDYVPLVVLYGKSPELIERLRQDGPSRRLFRKLQPYTVNIRSKELAFLERSGCVEELYGLKIQQIANIYKKGEGLDIQNDLFNCI